jgi:hypothetical protein
MRHDRRGRKAGTGGSMTDKRSASIRLTLDVYDALKRSADEQQRSVEGQIRVLVHQHLKKLGTMPKGEK